MKQGMRRTEAGRRCRTIITYGVQLVVIGIGFLAVHLMAQAKSREMLTLSMDLKAEDYSTRSFYAEMQKTKEWVEKDGSRGAQYDGTYYNNMGHDIVDWSIRFQVPEGSYIDSSWNGTFELEDGWITMSPFDYNGTIFVNDNRTYGLILYTPMLYTVRYVDITGRIQYVDQDFTAYWILVVALCAVMMGIFVYIMISLRISKLLDAKDPYTSGHSMRVALYTKEVARRLGKGELEAERFYYIGLMHDVGKVGIPDEVLNKPGKLTPEERAVIERHTKKGGEILKEFTAIPDIVAGALYHHERYDGNGYPEGISGKEIPLCAGKQFDPDIVQVFITMIEDGFIEREVLSLYKK